MHSSLDKNLQGIVLMLLAMLLFVTMDALAKHLVESGLSAIQIVAVRSWMILSLLLVVLGLKGNLGTLRMSKPTHSISRGMLTVLAPLCFHRPAIAATSRCHRDIFQLQFFPHRRLRAVFKGKDWPAPMERSTDRLRWGSYRNESDGRRRFPGIHHGIGRHRHVLNRLYLGETFVRTR